MYSIHMRYIYNHMIINTYQNHLINTIVSSYVPLCVGSSKAPSVPEFVYCTAADHSECIITYNALVAVL